MLSYFPKNSETHLKMMSPCTLALDTDWVCGEENTILPLTAEAGSASRLQRNYQDLLIINSSTLELIDSHGN